MHFVADRFPVGSGSRNQKVQRLLPRVTGALGQHIIELPVGLRVQLVKYQARYIQAVLGTDFRRQHLIISGVLIVDDALSGSHDL